MSTAPRPRAPGAVLEGRYRMDGILARGGMSVVHRGMDLRLDRPVAIKVLDHGLAEDPAFVRRFEREARSAARLAHPGIVAVHDQGRDADGTVFLVLELVEGGTLRDVLREHGRLHPAAALTAIEQIVAALRVAHDRGLSHRDVKPENVLVSASGALKVADFGLVGAAWDSDDGGSDELILGTAAYLAPEQITESRADARSDLYAAGIVLFELLTGTPPHTGDSAAAIASAHVHTDVPPPSRRAPGIPRALDALTVSLTRRDPDRRPAGAADLLAAITRVRAASDLPFRPVPAPEVPLTPVADLPPPPRPLRGTRLLDVGRAPRRRTGRDDRSPDAWEHDDRDDRDEDDPDEWDDRYDGADELDDEPEEYGDSEEYDDYGDHDQADLAEPAGSRAVVDDVDDRIEKLARRRARTRARRVLAVWVVGVGATTVVAALTGWNVGLP